MNDVWIYDGEYWTWMSGSSLPNQSDSYGVKGQPSPTNSLGARAYATGWRDNDGYFWMFGGSNQNG
jgi:hypothetical protein